MILFQFHPYHNKTSLISIPIPETGHSFTHHTLQIHLQHHLPNQKPGSRSTTRSKTAPLRSTLRTASTSPNPPQAEEEEKKRKGNVSAEREEQWWRFGPHDSSARCLSGGCMCS